MDHDKQEDVLSFIIEKYLQNEVTNTHALLLLKALHDFPIEVSPHFQRLVHESCRRGNMETTKYLLETYPQSLELQTPKGETPLFTAMQNSKYDIVETLLDAKADLKHKLPNGDTILHVLSLNSRSQKKVDMLERINTLEPLMIKEKNIIGETILHLGASVGDFDYVKKVIELNGDVLDETYYGRDVLQFAIGSGNIQLENYIKGVIRNIPEYAKFHVVSRKKFVVVCVCVFVFWIIYYKFIKGIIEV
ncbi:ankyrin repeat-containing protein, putative [Entamoeba invadens IP1]|uniref:Ankyrin repeat-containing protein, putative n=1 Tax=Entamoeba invadens IP1 TaxID=370355 RepID=A0A0A1UFG7_ENTIV|nr:ankyrin repeat-containing protein, putative [Entamoeba invadens IP1]ELP91633.1 ankyrin repeat-containing protein, putative [Entamoeba invadens IP1]|eukprot:XP_004258404.1 ankyrin repeat-containing protein, putative [Entamoeba invadens IP1]